MHGITNKMDTLTKYTVGIFIGVILLLGGMYKVTILDNKIEVSLPSDVCKDATLTVTKDDFKLKCGWRIAFQADTIVHYYKTYGTDEWVQNNRFVGRNKNLIDLSLVSKEDAFDVVRTTRYRKGKQSVTDGTLTETYGFTKDKVKISYEYNVENTAEHRITMRIKKQYKSHLDAFDPYGHTGIERDGTLFYEGYGDMLIDPNVFLNQPPHLNRSFKEGDTISFSCNNTGSAKIPRQQMSNITLYNTLSGSWKANGTVALSTAKNGTNETVTFSRIIPHLYNRTVEGGTTNGTIVWNCVACNITGIGTPLGVGCNASNSGNSTLFIGYAPNPINITIPDQNDDDLNFLNGSGWDMGLRYNSTSAFPDGYINVTWEFIKSSLTTDNSPLNDNLTYNVTIFGSLNTSIVDSLNRSILTKSHWGLRNSTQTVTLKISDLKPDDYFITVQVCHAHNATPNGSRLCVSDTTDTAFEVFDYTISSITNIIRFSTQPNVTLGPALGQTIDNPFFEVTWLGNDTVGGNMNITFNYTQRDPCISLYVGNSNESANAHLLTGNVSTTVITESNVTIQPFYLFATKSSCSTTTSAFQLAMEVLDI